MKQLTEEQAIELAKSGIWKDWTPEEIVKFQLFQDKLCMNFSEFHKAIEIVFDRPVYTHEFALQKNLQEEYLGIRPKPSLEEIINLIPKDKALIIGI